MSSVAFTGRSYAPTDLDKDVSRHEDGVRLPALSGVNFEYGERNMLDILERVNPFHAGRTRREADELKRSIALIARVFSRNYDLEVLPSPSGGWACAIDPQYIPHIEQYLLGERGSIDDVPSEAFRPKLILYDEKDIRFKPQDEVMGVLRHEVGHANHTDYKLFFQGQRLAIDDGYLATSWAEIQNALEDPWVNNLEIAGSEVVRLSMSALYTRLLPEIVAKIHTQPVTRQLGLNILHYWLTGKNIPALGNQHVLDAFDRIRTAMDDYFYGKSAQENFETLRDRIWPVYKTFEAKAAQGEEQKELARRLSGSSLGETEGTAQSEDGKSHGFVRSAWNRIRRMFGFGGESAAEKRAAQEKALRDTLNKRLAESADEKSKSDLRQELAKQESELDKIDKDLRDHGEHTGRVPRDIDLEGMAQTIRDELEKTWNALPADLKTHLEKTARENLDRKQVENLRRDGSPGLQVSRDERTGAHILSVAKPPAQEEVAKARNAAKAIIEEVEREDAKEQAEMRARHDAEQKAREAHEHHMRETREMRAGGFEESEKDLYLKFRCLEDAMQQRISAFIKILDQYLPKKEYFVQGGEYYSGAKLNKQSVMRRAPLGDYRVYTRPEIALSHEPRIFVKLLIDNSGSMKGDKMEESLKTAIFWGRVLRRFGIPFSISFFGSQVADIMGFKDDYDDAKERVKPELMKRSDASGGWTDMGTPLTQIKQEMAIAKRHFPNFHGAVFVISDSGANTGITGDALRALICEMQKSGTVMNLILGDNESETASAQKLFGESCVIAPKDFRELPDEAFRVLRFTLERILRIYQPRR